IAVSDIFRIEASDPEEAATRETMLYEIEETVLRYQVMTSEYGQRPYCASIYGDDPDAEVLRRLRDIPVKRRSACYDPIGFDESFKSPMMLSIHSIHWVNRTDVEVDADFVCGEAGCLADFLYTLHFDGERWTVTHSLITLIA